MSATVAAQITEEQKQHFRDEGYMILERAIPDEHLQMLREECQFFIDLENRRMEAAGKESDGINHKGTRYFISQRFKESKRLHEFLFSELMAEICKATIGENSYLFWEQYVVKSAEKGITSRSFHRSGFNRTNKMRRVYLPQYSPEPIINPKSGQAGGFTIPFLKNGVNVYKHEA